MNPILEWILNHPRASWSQAHVRANYERINGANYVPGGTPAQQQAAGDAAWARARGQAYQQDRVRDALINIGPNQTVASALFNRLAASGAGVRVPVLLISVAPGAVTSAREIQVDVPYRATGAEMLQIIGDAVASADLVCDEYPQEGIIMYGASAL